MYQLIILTELAADKMLVMHLHFEIYTKGGGGD